MPTHVLEFRTKRPQAGIADFKADFCDRHFSGSKQVARVFHAAAGKEVMRCLAESRVEQAMEMEGRKAGFPGGGIQKDLRLVSGSKQVARTA
jgi:hypothetical protein